MEKIQGIEVEIMDEILKIKKKTEPHKCDCETIYHPIVGNIKACEMKGTDCKDEGMKHDDGKLMWDLLPLDAVEQIVEIMTYGAKKYAPNNWQKVRSNRYY